MADQIDARELASYQKASITPLAPGSSNLVSGPAIYSPLPGRFVVFPCPVEGDGAEPRVRVIKIRTTEERSYFISGQEGTIEGLAISGDYIDGVIRGNSLIPNKGGPGWIINPINPSFILITTIPKDLSEETSSDSKDLSEEASSSSKALPEGVSSGRYLTSSKVKEFDNSREEALSKKGIQPDSRVDIAANSAHESARNNVEHVTHDEIGRIESNFKRLDENSIRRVKQEYPRLSQYTGQQIKKKVIGLLAALKKTYSSNRLLQDYLGTQQPFGIGNRSKKEIDTNLKLFELEADEDIRRLTLRLFSKPVKTTLAVDAKPQYLVANPQDIHDKVQKDLLEFWKVHDPAKYKDAIETVSKSDERLFRPESYKPRTALLERLGILEELVVKSRLVLTVPLSTIDIDFLAQGHLADPKDTSYLSVFRLRTQLNVDNQAGTVEGEFAGLSGLLEPNINTEDELIGRLANAKSVDSTVRDVMRDAASRKKVLREKRLRLSKGSRVKQRTTRAPTVESLKAQVFDLEGHLKGRMADIGVYSAKFPETYSAVNSLNVDEGVHTVTVPVEAYDIVKDGLTVRAGKKTMTIAEAIKELNTRTFDRRKELHSLIDSRSKGNTLTVEQEERIHKLESLLSSDPKPIELKTAENIYLPNRVIAGMPSYWGDKEVLHPVSKDYFGMLLGTSVLSHEELYEAGETSELLHKLVGGGNKTHVQILDELLGSKITNVSIPGQLRKLESSLPTIKNKKEAAFVKSRIESLTAQIADADTPEKRRFLRRYHNYFENIGEYKKLAEENPDESLNAFVEYVQKAFFNKKEIDPRVLVSHGRNTIYHAKAAIYSAVSVHDDNAAFGSSPEELAEHLTEENPKLGIHAGTFGVETAKSKRARSDVRNILVTFLSQFLEGDPKTHTAVVNSFLNAENIRSAVEAVAYASVTTETMVGTSKEQVDANNQTQSLERDGRNKDGQEEHILDRLKGETTEVSSAEETSASLRLTVADILRAAQSRQEDIPRYDRDYESYLDKIDKGIKGEDGLRQKPPVPIVRATPVPRMGGSYVEDAAVEEVRMQGRFNLITDILDREDQLKAELQEVQSKISADPKSAASISLGKRAKDLKAQIESEPNNRMRRLYGVRVTEDNQLAVVTPDDIERSLAEKTPIHFFGTHEDDVQRVLANKTPQELIDIAHSVGLKSGVNLEGKRNLHFYTPEDDSYQHREERVDQHLELHPFDAGALHEKAFLQAQNGDLTNALHTITEASKADSTNVAISNGLKVLEDIEWRKNIPVYKPDLKKGVKLQPNSSLEKGWNKNTLQPYLDTRKVSGSDLTVNNLLDPNPPSLSHLILKKEAEEWANSHDNFSAELQSPAVRAIASEAYQTGVFRHIMFGGYVKPQDYVQDPSLTAEQNTKLEQLSQQRKIDYPMRQAGAPKGTLYAPANTPEDRLYQETLSGSSNTSPVHHTESIAAQEVAVQDPKLALERLMPNPDLFKALADRVAAEGWSFDSKKGSVEYKDHELVDAEGRAFPISTEAEVSRKIPLRDFVTAFGANAPDQRSEDKHRGVINYKSDSMKIYELTGVDPISGKTISRTISYNYAVPEKGVRSKGHLLGDAHERAIKFFTEGTQNVIVLDTETDRHTRSLFSTSILKIGADSKEMQSAENYTRSFYESRKLDYLQENKIDPDLFQLPGLRMDLQQKREQKELELEKSRRNMRSKTSKDQVAIQARVIKDQEEIKAQALKDRAEIIASEDAHFEKMNPGFKFTTKEIQTQEEQVIHYAELLRKGLRDGNTVVAAHNAEFDLSVLAENARSLATAHGLMTNLGVKLNSAANFFENVLPKHTIDSAHVVQIAYPDRTSTQLEKVAVDEGILSPGEQTHTSLADSRVVADIMHLALSKENPKKFELKEVQDLGVMIFTDEARDAILVHKILPIDLSVGRDKVQVVGRRVSFEALKDTEGLRAMYAEMEANNSGVLVKELTTGYQISQRKDQGRLHLLSLESAAERADEMEGYQAGAVRDHARRMVRNAISPGQKSRADWTDLSILRGKIAEGFDTLTGDEAKKSYISSVLMAARTQTNSEDLPGIDFTEVTKSQVKHLRRFMSDDMYGSIHESHFRKAVILAKDTLVQRQETVDKRFLEEVTPLLKDGSITTEQYKKSRIAYTKLVNTISPSPKVTLESQDVVPKRSVTLSSYTPSSKLRSTEIDLTHLDQDDIMQQLQSHADSVVPKMPSSMTEFQQRQVTMRRLTKDVRESSQAFRDIPLQQNIQGLANTILTYAARNPSLGTKEGVLINDDLHVPEMRPTFDQDMNRELKQIGSTTNLPTALSAAPAREERQRNAAVNAEKTRRSTLSRSEPAPPRSEENESPFSTQVPPMGQDSGYTGGSAPHRTVEAPELGENLSNTFRNIFTKATSMEITPENVKVGLAFAGGVTALGLTLLGIHQASRSSQKEAGAGDSDEAPMTADRVNRAAESDLRGGGSGDEAAEGYRKLKVTIRGSHLGIGGSRLSEEALQAISQDVSSTLQKHLGAELDPDGSIYGQSGQSAPARPWVINEVMGRILGKR